MNNDAFEKVLQDKLNNLSKTQDPQRDLWPGIEQAMDSSPNGDIGQRFTAIAATIVLLAGTLFVWQMIETEQSSVLISQLRTNHEQQMNILYTNYEDQQALTENWQQQLQELDGAAQEILSALKKDPENIDLLRMLKNVYQQQLNLVERVHQPKWQYIYDVNREVAL